MSKFDKNIPKGSVPNCRSQIATRYAIRWFKYKLKPPKKLTVTVQKSTFHSYSRLLHSYGQLFLQLLTVTVDFLHLQLTFLQLQSTFFLQVLTVTVLMLSQMAISS